jgi:hypothetical protein
MTILFATACALVFLPVRGLHLRLEAYKTAREGEFTKSLETELSNIRDALRVGDENQVKVVADRLKLVQALDPTVLKLTTWPFDKTSLVKYGITPLFSLGASLGKEAFKFLHYEQFRASHSARSMRKRRRSHRASRSRGD